MYIQVSWHFRGPLNLLQFASYTPGSATTKKTRRSKHLRRHAHGAAPDHGHEHRKRQVGAIVTATIIGDVVSWTNSYDGSTPSTSTAAPASSSVPSLAYSAPAPSGTIAPGNTTTDGSWGRNGYYDANSQESDGIVFLNHFGGADGSGVFDYAFGASLSYASCDGTCGAASPQILENTTLPSSAEVIIMTDRQCTADSCGYVRPGTVAYEGFDGDQKAFFFEFSMPDSGETTNIYHPVNMPAIWMLNAQIPRTLQYGNVDCSCWSSGCGEFDMFEVLAPGDERAKTTLHGNQAGGSSDYFARPESGSIKVGMVLYDGNIHIQVLDDSISYDSVIGSSVIDDILSSTSTAGPGVSLFNLAGAASG